MVDTDTCSAYLKGNGRAFGRFQQYRGAIYISTLTLGELYTWAYLQGANSTARVETLEFLLSDVHAAPVDERIALTFGTTRASLLSQGVVLPEIDLFIAAIALHLNFTVVTNNEKHFRPVPGLRVQNRLV